ncbi:unnamed protein product [Rhizoctonia solani]|uniref:Uncharacterized protein n=1 Tax=Rhizoctonia solani TaxID=456999 RepID=A0A8H2XUD1_9AGAM|nr:unnamed protein product [Rhizoctonia solani]
MASLALPLARTSARIAWSSRLFGLGITTGPVPSGTTLRLAERLSALPSLRTLLELFPPIVLAVPKKKTSPSKKRMRSANKGLKDKTMFLGDQPCVESKSEGSWDGNFGVAMDADQ